MGVVTDKELKGKGAVKAPALTKAEKQEKEKKEAIQRELKKVVSEYECGWAPAGKSNMSFLHTFEGVQHEYKIALENRRYKLPANLRDIDKIRYRKALLDNGFIDVTKIKAAKKYDKEKRKYIYRVMHPEHSDKNRINGNISLALFGDDNRPMFNEEGKQVYEVVNISEGIVVTDNEKIYEALLKAGFYDAGKAEKEE